MSSAIPSNFNQEYRGRRSTSFRAHLKILSWEVIKNGVCHEWKHNLNLITPIVHTSTGIISTRSAEICFLITHLRIYILVLPLLFSKFMLKCYPYSFSFCCIVGGVVTISYLRWITAFIGLLPSDLGPEKRYVAPLRIDHATSFSIIISKDWRLNDP